MATKHEQRSGTELRPDVALFKALSHDLRTEILTILNDQGMSSPAQIARQLGESVGNVTNHMKQLEAYGCAEFVESRKPKSRGSVEHLYRATSRPLLTDEQWEQMSPAARDGFTRKIFRHAFNDFEEAFEAGTVDKRTNRHISRVPMLLDEIGWENAMKILGRAMEDLLDEHAKSAERRAETGEEPVRVAAFLTGIELPQVRKR